MMVFVRRFDPQLTNFMANLAYNLSYFISIVVTGLMMVYGTYIKIMILVFKQFTSNWVRVGAFIVTTVLALAILSSFCVIEYFFNSQCLNSL